MAEIGTLMDKVRNEYIRGTVDVLKHGTGEPCQKNVIHCQVRPPPLFDVMY